MLFQSFHYRSRLELPGGMVKFTNFIIHFVLKITAALILVFTSVLNLLFLVFSFKWFGMFYWSTLISFKRKIGQRRIINQNNWTRRAPSEHHRKEKMECLNLNLTMLNGFVLNYMVCLSAPFNRTHWISFNQALGNNDSFCSYCIGILDLIHNSYSTLNAIINRIHTTCTHTAGRFFFISDFNYVEWALVYLSLLCLSYGSYSICAFTFVTYVDWTLPVMGYN